MIKFFFVKTNINKKWKCIQKHVVVIGNCKICFYNSIEKCNVGKWEKEWWTRGQAFQVLVNPNYATSEDFLVPSVLFIIGLK